MEQLANNTFQTQVVNLYDLDLYNFTIPTYQRPYVWGDEQLKKLLDDFYTSFKHNPDSAYYISTFLTKEQGKLAEVIDGQQRFTSLWLIAFVINQTHPHTALSNFLKNGDNLRLKFEIRHEVSDFLNDLLTEEKVVKRVYDQTFIESYPYLKNIAKALVFIKSYLKQLIPSNDIESFSNFIYYNVYLIKNTTPENTDLNKLFSTINSAGVQLEQTDIVKANLLNLINDKVKHGKIWEACENMNNFFERNARASFPVSNWGSINLEHQVSFDETIFRHESDGLDYSKSSKPFTIDDVDLQNISEYNFPDRESFTENKRDSEEIYCRSVINFGQLLLHTYRIHLKIEGKPDFEGTFHVSRLIEVFKELEERQDAEEIKRFFLLLWDIRYLFDKYLIKWVSDIDNKTETLELVNFNKNDKSYYSRTKYAKSASLMLQSVLYFTGDYLRQYWLSSYLDYLYYNNKDEDATSQMHLKYLEKLDNIFSLDKSVTDKELSWKLMHQTKGFQQDLNIKDYLSSFKGTGFKHYWFQKLEYILWKNWKIDGNDETQEYLNYRITSRNSIEHIYPQNPENRLQHPVIDVQYLHSFGNLVLLSVSQNSEYSNKSVKVKQSMFNEKRETYDTLKSFCIFREYVHWSINDIEAHKDKMISKIISHYNHA